MLARLTASNLALRCPVNCHCVPAFNWGNRCTHHLRRRPASHLCRSTAANPLTLGQMGSALLRVMRGQNILQLHGHVRSHVNQIDLFRGILCEIEQPDDLLSTAIPSEILCTNQLPVFVADRLMMSLPPEQRLVRYACASPVTKGIRSTPSITRSVGIGACAAAAMV